MKSLALLPWAGTIVLLAVTACSDSSTEPALTPESNRAALSAANGSDPSFGLDINCPSQFQPTGANGSEEDANGDGYICQYENPSGESIQIDNQAGHKVGSCPPNFGYSSLGGPYWTREEDRNLNKLVCVKFLPNGKTVVTDDNQDPN